MDKINSYSGGIHNQNISQEYTKSADTYNNAHYLTNHQGEIVGFERENKKVFLPHAPGDKVVYTKEEVNDIIDNYDFLKKAIKDVDTKRTIRRPRKHGQNTDREYKVKKFSENSDESSRTQTLSPESAAFRKELLSRVNAKNTKSKTAELNTVKFKEALKERNVTLTESQLRNAVKNTRSHLYDLQEEKEELENPNVDTDKTNQRTLEDNARDIKDVEKKLVMLQGQQSMLKKAKSDATDQRIARKPGKSVSFEHVAENLADDIKSKQGKKRLLKTLMSDQDLYSIKEEDENVQEPTEEYIEQPVEASIPKIPLHIIDPRNTLMYTKYRVSDRRYNGANYLTNNSGNIVGFMHGDKKILMTDISHTNMVNMFSEKDANKAIDIYLLENTKKGSQIPVKIKKNPGIEKTKHTLGLLKEEKDDLLGKLDSINNSLDGLEQRYKENELNKNENYKAVQAHYSTKKMLDERKESANKLKKDIEDKLKDVNKEIAKQRNILQQQRERKIVTEVTEPKKSIYTSPVIENTKKELRKLKEERNQTLFNIHENKFKLDELKEDHKKLEALDIPVDDKYIAKQMIEKREFELTKQQSDLKKKLHQQKLAVNIAKDSLRQQKQMRKESLQ